MTCHHDYGEGLFCRRCGALVMVEEAASRGESRVIVGIDRFYSLANCLMRSLRSSKPINWEARSVKYVASNGQPVEVRAT